MIELFTWSAAVLAAAGAVFIAVLAARRAQLSRRDRLDAAAEARLRPTALALVEGELLDTGSLSGREGKVLARVLARYARRLHGGARGQIAIFFERGGHIERELAALGSRRGWQRATAAFVLGDMGSDRAVPALTHALADSRREVRSAAARSLGRLGAADSVEPIVYALARREVPWAVGGQALLAIGPAALSELRALEARAEPGVRAAAVELVGHVGNASDGPLLLERLQDSSADVRAKAALALGRLGAEEASADLRESLRDRMPFVRAAAAAALGMIGDRDAIEDLLIEARANGFDSAQAAATALALIDPRAVEAAAAVTGSGPHLREAADRLGVRAA